MKPSNKLQTLLTDLRDKIQRRQWHVDCRLCVWTVRNLEHERFALARGKAHTINAHGWPGPVAVLRDEFVTIYEVWHTRA